MGTLQIVRRTYTKFESVSLETSGALVSAVLQTDSHFITVKQVKMIYPILLALSNDRKFLELQLSARNKT